MVAPSKPPMGPEPSSLARRARRLGLDRATLVVFVGLLTTGVAYWYAAVLDEHREIAAFRQHARLFGAVLQKRLDRSFELMNTVPALIVVKPELNSKDFSRFVRQAGEEHAALQWAPRVAEAERTAFEARAKADVAKNYEIREAKGAGLLVHSDTRTMYVPILFVEPPNPEILGFDLYSEESRRNYVERARDSGKAVVSERFELIEEQQPAPALAVYIPVYRPGQPITSEQQRRSAFMGVVVGVLRPAQLVPSGLAGLDTATLDVALTDPGASSEEASLLYESSLGAEVGIEAAAEAATFPLRIGDRKLNAMFAPGIGFKRLSPRYRFHVALSGLGLTLFLALGFAVLRTRRVVRAASRAAEQLGQYEVLEEIGRGGMGVVYKARHSTLRRATAIKLLTRPSESLRTRFEREARVTSRLRHPNTVQIYDYGRTPEGALYYAMEFVTGISLSELVKSEGPQSPARVVHLLEQIVGSLAEAHAEGLVHRDIKPANIMVQSKGGVPDFVTVLDFGLVRDLSMQETLTGRNVPIGTPAYMSPEQIRDETVSESADLYALGGVAYYLLTATPPFQAATAVEVCMGHLNQQPEPPSRRLGRALPPDLEALVLQLLEKDPANRPPSALDVLRRLQHLEGVGVWDPDQARLWWSRKDNTEVDVLEGPVSGNRRTITVDFSSRS